MKPRESIATLFIAIFSSHVLAGSMLIPVPNMSAPPSAGLAELLSVRGSESNRFMAVGHLRTTIGEGVLCTATLIAGSEDPDPGMLALILTAGHCNSPVELLGDNGIVINKSMPPGYTFTPAFFYDNVSNHQSVGVTRIIYGSMKGTDVAILETSATYGELSARDIKPLVLDDFLDSHTKAVEVAHIPIGLFRDRYMRRSLCDALLPRRLFESTEPLREDNPWFWPVAIPSDCIGVYGGSSGAPVFAAGGTRVKGVLFTAVDGSPESCGYGRPCEITEEGVISRPDAVYFNPIDVIHAALRADSTIDLSKLDLGNGIGLERTGPWSTPSTPPASWNLRVTGDFEWVRFKTGPASTIQCGQPKGYGEPVLVSEQPLLVLKVDEKEGIYAICAIGQPGGAQAAWQSMRHATIKLRQIENTPSERTASTGH